MQRRAFLAVPVAAVSVALLDRLELESGRLARVGDAFHVPLRFFTESEARVVAAACDRIFPSDASGPGAKDASVVLYIDRQLAGPYGRDARRYTKGPWQANSIPEHGYQGRENPQQVYRSGIRELGNFASLSAEQQDARLAKIENTHFFQLLRTHTIEGMFCDPIHGGNTGLVGWKLVGFPGPRMSYYADIDQHNGRPFRPAPAGLQQITGEKITPWEDGE